MQGGTKAGIWERRGAGVARKTEVTACRWPVSAGAELQQWNNPEALQKNWWFGVA